MKIENFTEDQEFHGIYGFKYYFDFLRPRSGNHAIHNVLGVLGGEDRKFAEIHKFSYNA